MGDEYKDGWEYISREFKIALNLNLVEYFEPNTKRTIIHFASGSCVEINAPIELVVKWLIVKTGGRQ